MNLGGFLLKLQVITGGGALLIYLSLIDTQEEKDKFEEIYDLYKYTMLYVAKSIVRDQLLAEDIVHDSFLKIIEILDKINDISCSKTKSLIVTIVRNKSIDYIRKIKKESNIALDEVEFSLQDDEPIPLDKLINEEGYNKLLEYIDELDEKYRSVIELKYIHGYSEKEISKILDITEKNANIRIYRARKMLINRIEGEEACYDKSGDR